MTGLGGTTVDVSGSYLQDGTGSNNIYLNIITHGGNLTFTGPITLMGNSSFDSSPGGGNVNIFNTIDGTHNLTLASGAGDINLNGALGGNIPIGSIIISTAANVTTQAITAASVTQNTGTGTTNFQGNLVTSGNLGISISTRAITRGADLITTGGGPVTINNLVGTFTSIASGTFHLTGPLLQNGTGPVTLAGEIFTEDQPITFSSAITLAGDADIDSGNLGANITLLGPVDGAFNFEVCPVGGDLIVSSDIGSSIRIGSFKILRVHNAQLQRVFASEIIQTNGSGTTTFNNSLNTNTIGGFSLQGTSFIFNRDFTTTSGGPVLIRNVGTTTFNSLATGNIAGSFIIQDGGAVIFSSSITSAGAMQFLNAASVSGSASLSTAATNQSMTFFNTLNGPGNLTCDLGTGDLIFSSSVGSGIRLGNLTVSSVRNITTQALSAGSLIQSSGTGTSLFQGVISTNSIGGISITGNAITFIDDVTTSNLGPIAIANSGPLLFSAGKTVNSDSTFTQTNVGGTGTISLAGTIQTNNSALSIASPITLASDAAISTGSGIGTITIAGTIDGAALGSQNLTLTGGLGDINLSSALGVGGQSVSAKL